MMVVVMMMAATTVEGFMVAVFFFMYAMAFATAAVFFMFLCVVFPTSARDFFFFFHNWLVLFSAKLRTPFCNWVAKEGDEGRGDEYCGGQARLKIQQGHGPERWPCSLRVRGPHFASKVSYNAGAATDDCAGQCKSPPRRRCRQLLTFDIIQKGVHQKIPMYTFIYNIYQSQQETALSVVTAPTPFVR